MASKLNGGRPDPEPIPDSALDVDAEALAQAADALFAAMRRARSTAATRDGDLSLAQLGLLEPLAEQNELPVGKLAANADVSVPTATRMLQQLETKGVVTRRRSPQDERKVLISLTERGAAMRARLQEELRERQARAFAAFTPAERVQLVTLTRRLTELVEDSG